MSGFPESASNYLTNSGVPRTATSSIEIQRKTMAVQERAISNSIGRYGVKNKALLSKEGSMQVPYGLIKSNVSSMVHRGPMNSSLGWPQSNANLLKNNRLFS